MTPESTGTPTGAGNERRGQLIAIAILAALGVAVLIFVSQSGNDPKQTNEQASESTAELLRGLPQTGTVLGEPDAPVTLTEFGDPQCPFCAQFANDVLPEVIKQYVASGDLKIDFQPLTFIGPDSVTAARVAVALIPQKRYWNFIELFYKQQQAENSGYATDDYLRGLLGEIEGVDVAKTLEQASLPSTDKVLDKAKSSARQLGVSSTPSLYISSGGGEPQALDADTSDTDAVLTAIGKAVDEQ